MGLRPILGPAACKFDPSCGNYALQQFNEQSFHKAVWLIIRRLLSCR